MRNLLVFTNESQVMHHTVIKRVLEKFRGLPSRLAELTGMSDEWFRSHGRPPRTSINPIGTGNKWQPIEDIYEAVELYEKGAKGAGVMLICEIASDIAIQYGSECSQISQKEMKADTLREATEAVLALDKVDFENATLTELRTMQLEMSDVMNVSSRINGMLIARIREKEMSR